MGSICGGNSNQNEVTSETGRPGGTKIAVNNASAQDDAVTTQPGAQQESKTNDSGSGNKRMERVDSGGKQEITIRIIQARNLPSTDVLGKTDAFVMCNVAGKNYQTSIIKRTNNPIWNDDVVLSGNNLFSKIRDVTFDVYDWDRFSKNDHIGHFEIHFCEDLDEVETPALWYQLKDKDGNKVGNAEVQVQIQMRRDINKVMARNYTHILSFTVRSGHDLKNMDWLDKGDPYVSVEVGRQVFRTKAVKNTKNPKWDQSIYLFVDTDIHKDYQLVVSVLDKDLHNDDHVGTGYIPIKSIFDSKDRTFQDFVNLQERVINLDKGLRDTPVLQSGSNSDLTKVKSCGRIEVAAQLIPRRKIEDDFYENLLQYFDINKDGILQRQEVKQMLAYLEIAQPASEFLEKFDENYDAVLKKEEVLKMLRDSKFQDSDDSSKFILYHLQRDPEYNPFASKLMEGFFREDLDSATASKTLYVRSRRTGVIVAEHIPGYIHFALNAMYDNKAGKLLSETKSVQKILHKMSKDKGVEYDSPASKKQISAFIATHNLDTSILRKNVNEFATFNDFFARDIKVEECRKMSEDENEIVSPADCRMMVWNNIYDSTNVWIKGDQFSVEGLFGPRKSVAADFDGGAFCIARLAPQDYHRWHWPVSGKVTKITHIDGALFTVNPIAINRNVNVYTENKRAVIEMETTNHGKMVMFAIAAAMVGSMSLFRNGSNPLVEGCDVKRGDVSGEFRFGGSTILLLFERKRVEFKQDLIESSDEKLETLIEVRETIGGLPGKTNISNIVKQFSG